MRPRELQYLRIESQGESVNDDERLSALIVCHPQNPRLNTIGHSVPQIGRRLLGRNDAGVPFKAFPALVSLHSGTELI